MTGRLDLPLLRWGDDSKRRADAATRHTGRRRVVVAVTGIAGLLSPGIVRPLPRLIWNATPSSPTGLYVIAPGADAARGDTVAAWLPGPARALADQRHYVPAAVPVIKTVAAVSGDRACAKGPDLTINGRVVARRLPADRRGRPLPRFTGCITLGRDAVLLVGRAPDSFDGRYFGAISRQLLIGQARLIWAH